MRALAALIAVGLGLPAPAAGQPVETLSLDPEQAVTLRFDPSGKSGPEVTERGRAEWTPFDLAVARDFVSGVYDSAVGDNSVPTRRTPDMPEPRPLLPGSVRVRFMHLAGRHSELILENGYDLALSYRAAITIDGETRPTDVCIVVPNNRSAEHWPERIERIALFELRLIPWGEGRRVTCA